MIRNETLKIIEQKRSSWSLAQALRSWQSEDCPLELAEDRELIQHAISKLPREQAEVIVLKIWENFTFAEIAETIGESANTAASRYRYALEKLTLSLQPLTTKNNTPLKSSDREVNHV